MRRDPLIIGGGPAGAAAAITLARAGRRPVVLERTNGPTDKVCGDFLSVDTIRTAQALGVDPRALGAVPIERVRVVRGDRVAETPLPFAALSLSRRTLDLALLEEAGRAGAAVHAGVTVRHLNRGRDARGGCDCQQAKVPADSRSHGESVGACFCHDSGSVSGAVPDDGPDGGWIAQTGDRTLVADTVFLATGKHDLRDLPRPRNARGAVGMKMYYRLAAGAAQALERTVELTLFPGGYAGMQPVEGGRTALCIAVRRQDFQTYGADWAGLIAQVRRGSPRFAALLGEATPLLARPIAVAGIPYGYQAGPGSEDGLFRIGDQAAVIPSLTGDGMAIALQSGRLAAQAWLRGADSAAYHRALNRSLTAQMRLAGLLHRSVMSPPVQVAALRAAALFPGLLRQAALRTRLSSRS